MTKGMASLTVTGAVRMTGLGAGAGGGGGGVASGAGGGGHGSRRAGTGGRMAFQLSAWALVSV